MYDERTAQLEQRVERIEGAFPQDAQGKPRYYDCRRFLTDRLDDEELISDIKDGAIKQVAGWAVAIMLAVLGLYLKFKTGLEIFK